LKNSGGIYTWRHLLTDTDTEQ